MKQNLLILLALALGMASSTWAEDVTISSASELVAFATRVNGGETTLNATLTADIDMSSLASWTPIGDWNTSAVTSAYCGHFDGQGHTITGFNFTASQNYFGIFGVISTGALIENFSVYGTVSCSYKTMGVVGYARDATPTIRNIHSYLNINNTVAGNRHGGILGSSVNGTIVIDRCTYSGTLDGNDNADNGNYGGIVGYTNNNANAHLRVTNCLFNGELKNTAETPGKCTFGGIVGYVGANPDVTITNCLSFGSIQSAITGQFYGAVKHNTCSIINSFYKGDNINGSSSTVTPTTQEVTLVTDAQLASGEICYALNGDQSTINWFQTLNDDDCPTPNGTDIVYLAGRLHCDGTAYEDVSGYSNTPSTQDSHDFTDGFCSYCSILDPTYMTPIDGNYMIGTPAQFKWFAAFVNAGNPAVNAKLTANINLSGITWTPIGNADVKYTGTFDGGGFTISNLTTEPCMYNGLFGYIDGATVKDFSINGNIQTLTSGERNYIGVIGISDNISHISGIHSSLNITVSCDSDAGGVIGSGGSDSSTAKLTIDKCSFSGTLAISDGVTSDQFGGIVGYTAAGTITNCLFNGTLTGNASNKGFGGIVGYTREFIGGIQNCLSIGTISGTGGRYGAIIGNFNSTTDKTDLVKNNYYISGSIAGSGNNPTKVSTTGKTAYEMANGEVAYLLNGDQSTISFYQTIGTDDYPTLDSSHSQVYVNGTVCPDTGTPQGTVSYSNAEGTTVGTHNYVDGFCSYCSTLNETYMTPIDGSYMIGTPAQLKWFAAFVNAGHPAANAKLANITPLDLTGVTVEPIGNSSAAYTGTFDGQGKSITGFSATSTGRCGLFGNISNATIKDFSIDGTMTVNSGTGSGVIGWATNSTISGIHSTLDIAVPGDDAHHAAGVVGSCQGDNTVSGCSFAGTLTVTGNTRDCFGGVVGYFKNDNLTNCANYGSVSYTRSDGYVGGVIGYISNTSAHVTNSLATGTITYAGEGTPTYGGTLIGRILNHNPSYFSNNYWLTGTAPEGRGSGGNTVAANQEATAEELASGEVAYKLGAAWYQTIGTDDTPVLDSSSEQVLYVGAAGYTTFFDADNDWALNGDAQAYIGIINGSALHLDEIDDIPAGTAVVISGTYYNKVSTTATATATGNVLRGSDGSVSGDGSTIFALANGANGVGFYLVGDGIYIPAGKAYLIDTTGSAVKGFTFVFDDDATGISGFSENSECSDAIYNLSGQRIQKMQKGINIVNGRKILK